MKYAVTIKKTTSLILQYSDDGVLMMLEIRTPELRPDQVAWIMSTMPAEEKSLNDLKRYNFIGIDVIPQDLSFNAFWEAYNYKVGKKERALKYWTALTETERMLVFKAIPKYNYWLAQRPNMDRLYPEGFLHQRRFENEFNKK